MVCSNVKYTKHSTDTVYLKRQCISLFYLWLHPQLLDTWSYILCFLYFVFLEDYYSFRSSPLTRSTKKPELFNLCVCVCVCMHTCVRTWYLHLIYRNAHAFLFVSLISHKASPCFEVTSCWILYKPIYSIYIKQDPFLEV